jgi:hypothetical protein
VIRKESKNIGVGKYTHAQMVKLDSGLMGRAAYSVISFGLSTSNAPVKGTAKLDMLRHHCYNCITP